MSDVANWHSWQGFIEAARKKLPPAVKGRPSFKMRGDKKGSVVYNSFPALIYGPFAVRPMADDVSLNSGKKGWKVIHSASGLAVGQETEWTKASALRFAAAAGVLGGDAWCEENPNKLMKVLPRNAFERISSLRCAVQPYKSYKGIPLINCQVRVDGRGAEEHPFPKCGGR